MIELVDVSQHYDVRLVLRNITLRIGPETRVAVLGPNGMGKSTLLGVTAGVLPPQKGYVAIDGLRRRSSVEAELAIRRRVFYLPDQPFFPRERTAREFLVAVGRVYSVDADRLFDHVERLLSVFELTEIADSRIRTYSAGQLKKTGLCAAFISDAPILLLDEPFSGGLDPSGILVLKRLLERFTAGEPKIVVMSAPVPELMEQVADRFVILDRGRVTAEGTLDELRAATGCPGSLADVLERIMYPQAREHLERYFEAEHR